MCGMFMQNLDDIRNKNFTTVCEETHPIFLDLSEICHKNFYVYIRPLIFLHSITTNFDHFVLIKNSTPK